MKRSRSIHLSCFYSSRLRAWSQQSVCTGKSTTIKVASWFPVGGTLDNIYRNGVRIWSRELAVNSKSPIMPGVRLFLPQTYDAVVKGITDVGNHVLGYSMGRFPFFTDS